ncbi:hypothetical protein DIPPA_13188 [Diplonema papillatum]|nr:hypothetical protein DIPPA_13188 [Diplonema papillatum]
MIQSLSNLNKILSSSHAARGPAEGECESGGEPNTHAGAGKTLVFILPGKTANITVQVPSLGVRLADVAVRWMLLPSSIDPFTEALLLMGWLCGTAASSAFVADRVRATFSEMSHGAKLCSPLFLYGLEPSNKSEEVTTPDSGKLLTTRSLSFSARFDDADDVRAPDVCVRDLLAAQGRSIVEFSAGDDSQGDLQRPAVAAAPAISAEPRVVFDIPVITPTSLRRKSSVGGASYVASLRERFHFRCADLYQRRLSPVRSQHRFLSDLFSGKGNARKLHDAVLHQLTASPADLRLRFLIPKSSLITQLAHCALWHPLRMLEGVTREDVNTLQHGLRAVTMAVVKDLFTEEEPTARTTRQALTAATAIFSKDSARLVTCAISWLAVEHRPDDILWISETNFLKDLLPFYLADAAETSPVHEVFEGTRHLVHSIVLRLAEILNDWPQWAPHCCRRPAQSAHDELARLLKDVAWVLSESIRNCVAANETRRAPLHAVRVAEMLNVLTAIERKPAARRLLGDDFISDGFLVSLLKIDQEPVKAQPTTLWQKRETLSGVDGIRRALRVDVCKEAEGNRYKAEGIDDQDLPNDGGRLLVDKLLIALGSCESCIYFPHTSPPADHQAAKIIGAFREVLRSDSKSDVGLKVEIWIWSALETVEDVFREILAVMRGTGDSAAIDEEKFAEKVNVALAALVLLAGRDTPPGVGEKVEHDGSIFVLLDPCPEHSAWKILSVLKAYEKVSPAEFSALGKHPLTPLWLLLAAKSARFVTRLVRQGHSPVPGTCPVQTAHDASPARLVEAVEGF